MLLTKAKSNRLSTPRDSLVVLWRYCYGFSFHFTVCQKINHKSDAILFLFALHFFFFNLSLCGKISHKSDEMSTDPKDMTEWRQSRVLPFL